jgi:hypothetical protein
VGLQTSLIYISRLPGGKKFHGIVGATVASKIVKAGSFANEPLPRIRQAYEISQFGLM